MSIRDTVSCWFRERLANGPLARDTEAYNQVIEALPDLVGRLGPAAAAAPADETASPKGARAAKGAAPDSDATPAG